MFSTARSRPSSITSRVIPPLCGVRTTLGSSRIGSPAGIGSSGKTSSAAPASRPARSASISAAFSTSPPRAVLIRNAVGFIRASRVRLRYSRVAALRRRWRLTKSASRRSSSTATWRAPTAAARPWSGPWVAARRRIPKGWARAATRRPMAPRPIRPSVRPSSWTRRPRGHWPARTSRSIAGIRRPAASIRASVCSATAWAFTPGVLVTATPRAWQAARSTLSVPVPQIEMRRSRGHAASTRSVNRA